MKEKAKFIVWQNEWATNIKTIDDQHKHFIGIVNRAYLFYEDKKNKKILGEILSDLLEYAKIHFSTEEGYFDDTDYPQASMHKNKHEKLIEKAISFSQRFKAEQDFSILVEDFLFFLKEWLDDHLIKIDHKYVPWLTEHGVK